ncbi:Transcriptional regulator, TetR family [Rhodococcus sp. RD6.2]|uniref:TetR/AcrR family transcriptional regulator n=1 Tax=Rhodococcus sp. RD6.2 TaxID=260936 RepID=UPI00063BC60F|nr:TetR/AcrR family transcriptional regulator [Rhodococcus sp. RD6.2]CRK50426.1 Transcriptional regulator, TetR family [Rhodococcus sp. RD6.2]
MTDQLPHMLRADAQDNRDRVMDAAKALFSEYGLTVTMREIARRAGVGPATLYRRFPTKQVLVEEAFAQELRACRDIVDDGAADPDPWRGFCAVIERTVVLNVRNHGFVEAFMSEDREAGGFAVHRATLFRKVAALARRAQAAGELRRDFVLDDVVLVLVAARGLASLPLDSRPAAARRYAGLAIDGFRASTAHGTLPRAPKLGAAVTTGRAKKPS